MENWRDISETATAIWTAFIIFMSVMPGMWVHTKRLFTSMKKRDEDFIKGHAYVNVFAEILRILKVPEKVIKARLGGKIGIPHVLSVLPVFSLIFGVIMLGMNISARKKQ